MKSLWLRRLPESTQAVLACVSGSLDALAAAADKVHEVNARPTIAAIQQPSEEIGELKREMAALVASMVEMSNAGRLAAGRQDSLRTQTFVGTIVKATRCTFPCKFAPTTKT